MIESGGSKAPLAVGADASDTSSMMLGSESGADHGWEVRGSGWACALEHAAALACLCML